MIVTPSGKYMESDGLTLPVALEGWFTLKAIRRSGRVTRSLTFKQENRQAGPFHNLITDIGLDRIGTQSSSFNIYLGMAVGLGTTPPSVLDTQLANFLGRTGRDTSGGESRGSSGEPDYYGYLRLRYTFGIGQLGNNNLTELGACNTDGTVYQFSRELIRDSNGDPVAFPISSDEQLQVTYELRNYPPLVDAGPFQVMVGPNQHDVLVRASRVQVVGSFAPTGGNSSPFQISTNQSAWQCDDRDMQSYNAPNIRSNQGAASSVSRIPYVAGSLYNEAATTYGASLGNRTYRTLIVTGNCFEFQTQYDPPIIKSNQQTLILNNRIAWARR